MELILQIQLACDLLIFLSIVLMNIAKKNATFVTLYLLQSALLSILLGIQSYQEHSLSLLGITLVMFGIKVVIAPQLFYRFLRHHNLTFSASTYANVPVTLGVVVLLSMLAQSDIFAPLASLLPHIQLLAMSLIGSILIAFFLLVNRRGALSQIIGVLSLENGVFAFGHFLGIGQSGNLEIGILFDVFFWIIVSSIFITMMYWHFGSLDVTELTELQR